MIWIVLLSVISAILYRAGGLSKEEKSWIPVWLRHSWVRDWLCPACVLIPFLHLMTFSNFYWWFLAYGAMGGMLSTYWDFLFGFDNFWFAGFMVGLSLMFLMGVFPWYLILGRAFLLAILWGGWSSLIGDADLEEYGRGAFLVSTLLLTGV